MKSGLNDLSACFIKIFQVSQFDLACFQTVDSYVEPERLDIDVEIFDDSTDLVRKTVRCILTFVIVTDDGSKLS